MKKFKQQKEQISLQALGTKKLDEPRRQHSSNPAGSNLNPHNRESHGNHNHGINSNTNITSASSAKLHASNLITYTAFTKKQISNFNQKISAPNNLSQIELGLLVKEIVSLDGSKGTFDRIESIYIELIHKLKKAFDINQSQSVRSRTTEKNPIPALNYLPIFYVTIQKRELLQNSSSILETFCHFLAAAGNTNSGILPTLQSTGLPNTALANNMNSSINSGKMTENKSSLIIILCNLMMVMYSDNGNWPILLVRCWLEDSVSFERTWTESIELCSEFSKNVITAFSANYPDILQEARVTSNSGLKNIPRQSPNMIEKENESENHNHNDLTATGHRSSPIPNLLTGKMNLSNFSIKNRYYRKDTKRQVEEEVNKFADFVTKLLNQLGPNGMPSKNLIKTLFYLTKFDSIQKLIIPLLENWMLINKITKCSQDLFVSLSLNLGNASVSNIQLLNKHLIEGLPKKLQQTQSGLKTHSTFNNQTIYSLLWRTMFTFYSNASNSHEKVAENILYSSFQQEITNNPNLNSSGNSNPYVYRHGNNYSTLNISILTHLIMKINNASNPNGNYLRQMFAITILDEIWRRKKPMYDKIKELLKILVNKALAHSSQNSHQNTGKQTPEPVKDSNNNNNICIALHQISRHMILNFKKFDNLSEHHSYFLSLILDLQIHIIGLMAHSVLERFSSSVKGYQAGLANLNNQQTNPSNFFSRNNDKEQNYISFNFHEPAAVVLSDVISWLTEEHNKLSPLKTLTILQKPFFIDNKIFVDNEFGKPNVTNLVLKICREIPVNGESVIMLFSNLLIEREGVRIRKDGSNLEMVLMTLDQVIGVGWVILFLIL